MAPSTAVYMIRMMRSINTRSSTPTANIHGVFDDLLDVMIQLLHWTIISFFNCIQVDECINRWPSSSVHRQYIQQFVNAMAGTAWRVLHLRCES